MSKYKKYIDLINLPTTYARHMKKLSNRIFTEVAIPTNETSMKVVKIFSARPLHTDPAIMEYYPRLVETNKLMMKLRDYGLYRDEHQDFNEEIQRVRALRGKAKPKRLFKWEREAAAKEK